MPLTNNNLSSYIKIMRIGQGAFGDVWLAEDIVKRRRVALKKLISKESRDGFSKSAIREIILLTNLKHRNIVDLYGVVFSRPHDYVPETSNKDDSTNSVSTHLVPNYSNKGSIWMVFEYLPYDLSGYIEALKLEGKVIKVIDIKIILRQILSSLDYCHMNNIIHRDIKCANLLITNDGIVKLADFGLARLYNMCNRAHTNRVITLWYRPPELLLGAQCYDTPVDIWSVGCILGELILQQPLFCSENEAGVLKSIGDTFGFPPDNVLSELKKLPLWNDQDNNPLLQIPESCTGVKYKQFTSRIEEKVGKQGLDLLLQLLDYSPNNRLTARQALQHPWLSNSPNEIIPERLDMSTFSHKKQFHSLSARKLREKLHGRFKIAPNEIGGATNAIIGKAYNVGQLIKIIEEERTKNTSNTNEKGSRQEVHKSFPSAETNIETTRRSDERQFKRSRSNESENTLGSVANKLKIRSSNENRQTGGYDRRRSANPTLEKEFERDEFERDRNRSDPPTCQHEHNIHNREKNITNNDKKHLMNSRYEGHNSSRGNNSQSSTPSQSPSVRTMRAQSRHSRINVDVQNWIRNSPPLKGMRECSIRHNSTLNLSPNIREHDKDRVDYNRDKR